MNDKVQKIRKEVERLYNQSLADENRQSDRGLERAANVSYGKSKACKELLSFIDSLQEEPVSEDLKEFEVEYIEREKDNIVCIYDRHAGLVDGAKWQKEQITSKAIDAKVEADLDPHGADYGIQRLECEYGQLEALKIKNESKVKVIVIKEDGI